VLSRREMDDAAFRRDRLEVAVERLSKRLQDVRAREEDGRRASSPMKGRGLSATGSRRSWRACMNSVDHELWRWTQIGWYTGLANGGIADSLEEAKAAFRAAWEAAH
jgi:hypothetical protein